MKVKKSIYLIGSLRNDEIQPTAQYIRQEIGLDIFDDWHSAGPETDDFWQSYERHRGHSYREALNGWHAREVFEFDKFHLDRCDGAILAMPAGKSGHLEAGYMVGCGKPLWILMPKNFEEDPSFRYDIMYRFARGVTEDKQELVQMLLDWEEGVKYVEKHS